MIVHKKDANRFVQYAWMRMIRFCGWNLLLAGQRGQEGITAKRKTGGDANGAGGIKRISAETLELLALDFLKKVAKKP